MSSSLGKLESLTGHSFKNIDLLERSITHRSWAFENMTGGDVEVRAAENESMEFLGDSVLGLVIAEELFSAHPDNAEGDLTLMKHHLVSTATLARLAQEMGLGEFMRVGRGEEKTGGRKKQALLADALEALIAAVFLDGGYSAARVFIKRVFAGELAMASPKTSVDYKTMLQEMLQAGKMTAPTYKVVETEGPPHARTFAVEAAWSTGKANGRGNSIKAAEMQAAAEALRMLREKDGHGGER